MEDGPRLVRDEEALFRYLLVARVRAFVDTGKKVSLVVEEVAGEVHVTFGGARRKVGARTLYRWLALFEEQGLRGLVPKKREGKEASFVLSAELLFFAKKEKEDDPRASIPEILRRARSLSLIGPETRIDRTTLYRALLRMGVDARRPKVRKDRDTRRFAWPCRMQMVLADGKHFRAGPNHARRVAVFFLDDATRTGLDVVVGTSEDTVLFLTGLYRVFRRVGKMDQLYLDKGPGFISDDTVAVVANLAVLLIHGEARYPQGHGMIEKFNQTVKDQVLRHLDGRPDVDPDPGALTVRLRHWLLEVYNRSPHEFLDGRTPEERFLSDERPLRLPESEQDLASRFVVTAKRTVSNDHVIPFDGIDYEVPTGHAGERIEVCRQVLTGRLFVLHRGQLVQIHPVDLAENAKSRRARKADEEPPAHPTRGAGDIAFHNDFGPVVDSDGGFTDTHGKERER
jgi:transposase InsO family protein